MPNRPPRRPLVALLAAASLVALLVMPGVARGPDDQGARDGASGPRGVRGHVDPRASSVQRGLVVLHGPVSITLADPASDGHQPGDLRVAWAATTDTSGRPLGRLDASLITTAIDVPEPGDEMRISTLVFSFGEDGASQVIVGGTAVYPALGGALATGTVTTRPIQGGSGRFAGASGWAVSEHLEDGTWRHTFTLAPALSGVRAGIRPLEHAPTGPLRAAIRARFAERLTERLRERAREALRPGAEARSTEPGIVRTALGAAQPGSAPGHDLGLWHYAIPAGATLEAHRHPGWQIARIVRGELAYTIISGEAEVHAADGTSRIIGLGTHVLRTGDSVIEHPELEHFGANLTHRDVEIVAATLYPEGAPLAIPVATPSPLATPSPAAVAMPSASPSP